MTLYTQKDKNTLQHLKLGKLKFGIRKIGCSMSWTRYIHYTVTGRLRSDQNESMSVLITFVASRPFRHRFFVNVSIISGSNSVIKISMVWSGSTSTLPDKNLFSGLRVYKYQQSLLRVPNKVRLRLELQILTLIYN